MKIISKRTCGGVVSRAKQNELDPPMARSWKCSPQNPPQTLAAWPLHVYTSMDDPFNDVYFTGPPKEGCIFMYIWLDCGISNGTPGEIEGMSPSQHPGPPKKVMPQLEEVSPPHFL